MAQRTHSAICANRFFLHSRRQSYSYYQHFHYLLSDLIMFNRDSTLFISRNSVKIIKSNELRIERIKFLINKYVQSITMSCSNFQSIKFSPRDLINFKNKTHLDFLFVFTNQTINQISNQTINQIFNQKPIRSSIK